MIAYLNEQAGPVLLAESSNEAGIELILGLHNPELFAETHRKERNKYASNNRRAGHRLVGGHNIVGVKDSITSPDGC